MSILLCVLGVALLTLIPYLLGCSNGAILVSKYILRDDIRNHGSGNAGMTNFARTYGKAKLVPVILIDVCKTLLACLIGWLLFRNMGYGDEAKMLAGIATMVGHALPVFYGFHGGKGVLSAAAIALSMNWWTALIALAIFFIILETTKYMSLASMTAVTLWCLSNIFLFWGKWFVVACLALIAILVVILHRGNIDRLLHGNERKTYLHKPKEG